MYCFKVEQKEKLGEPASCIVIYRVEVEERLGRVEGEMRALHDKLGSPISINSRTARYTGFDTEARYTASLR